MLCFCAHVLTDVTDEAHYTCLNPNTWRSLCPELRLQETSGENMHLSVFGALLVLGVCLDSAPDSC